MSIDRVAFIVLQVDGDSARAMGPLVEGREDVGVAALRRQILFAEYPTVMSLATGTRPHRHQALTKLVPADGATEGRSGAMVEAGLRVRTSRDLGAPTIWNRLAGRGIVSAVVGFPLAEAKDDDRVLELSQDSLFRIATENETHAVDAMLGAIRGGIEARPDIRFACLYGDFRDGGDPGVADSESGEDDDVPAGPDDDGDDDGDDDSTRTTVDGETKARVILSWLDAVRDIVSAAHMMVVLVGPRIGRNLVFGPHAGSFPSTWGEVESIVPTTLALLGEPPAADLPGRSLVAVSDDSAATGTAGWGIEGGTLAPPDFEPSIARALSGEGGPLLRTVVTRHLAQSNWIGLADGDPGAATEAGRRLLELDPSDINHLRTIVGLVTDGNIPEARALADSLREKHPESAITDIASLIGPFGLADDEVAAVLDRRPFQSLNGPLARGIWARSAARIERVDDAIDALWRLILGGYATRNDRLIFASLAVQRNQGDDARHAALATRGMSGLGMKGDGRPRVGVALLRARALSLSGRSSAAIALLERFIERHPFEEAAVAMLGKLREEA